ncbi:cyanophycin synthetase CphA [Gottschalkia acidurici 9a]|uniref:Cyanophycin synthetase n=1 Tax=Gottschalkia acidurici (strain ATCC 7906 / DSM 604 / BCRC 14475 / CIP 104303 / KCTC 5404 / NCIMB 10678 / 9a) TaxID=1128398 RepID=K0AZT4_GOTA9|nr:cyanophycin synthetase [Gottschalkia acidurici]AFS77866.1 cyanophycin synthetase CphA [Gottschalkia acidurici 9a]
MRIIDTKIFSGRNIYSHKPVIKVLVDLEELSDKTTVDFDGFNDHLLELFPSLIEHHCGLRKHGGFVERINEGTYFAHVVEHLILELQAILGYEVFFGKTRMEESPSLYNMIIEYCNENVAVECVKQSIYIIESIIKNESIDLDNILYDLNEIKERYELGPSTKAIFDEAKKRGIPARRLGNDSILELGYGKYSRLVQAALTDSTNSISIDISCNKQLTKQLLMENNIPVSYGDTANSIDEALEIAKEIGYPVVLKPLDGNQGKGVVLNINSPEELEDNFRIPTRYSDSILVEKYIQGKDYRVLVVKDKVSAVAERRAPKIVGDGVHTIKELVSMENENKLRGYGHEKPQTKIRLDRVALNYLEKNNLTEDSVPEVGQIVKLRSNGNISTGGSAIECTNNIHPYNIELAIKAAKIIGLDIAGIDIIAKDISKPITDCGGAIIEVNAVPGLRMHLHPTIGNSINVASDILDSIYPEGTPYSVPIVATTGTNGKTTTTRLIGHSLSRAGKKVGMTTSSGIYIDNKCILKGDNTGPVSARNVLSSKEIDIALLEVARGGLVRRGLGYDVADIAILTNIGDDHIGLDGIESVEDLAFAKSLVLEAVKPNGYSVINADDKMAEYLINRASGKLILFSQTHKNEILIKHIKEGNIALCIEEDSIYIYNNFEKTKLIDLNSIPITFNGTLECNVENVLAGSSALYGLGTPLDTIREGLETFRCDVKMNPGRFNIFELGNIKVMIDYGHNIGGYEEVGKFISKLNVSRSIGIIGVPGDRSDEQIFNIGVRCSEIFSKVYIKEDMVLRGRKPGEVANILYEGLLSGNFNEDNIKIVPSEIEALKIAVSESEDGDFVTLFYEELNPAVKLVTQLQSEKLNKNNVMLSALS